MGMSRGEAGVAAGLDDATRDACLHGLGDHYAAGRLSTAELDERVQLVLAAETEEDLAAVMTGLVEEPAVDQDAPATRPPRSPARRALRALLGFLAQRVATGRSRRTSEELPAAVPPTPETPDAAPSRDTRGDDVQGPAVLGPAVLGPDVLGPDVLGPDVVEPVDRPRAGPTSGGIVPRRVRHNGGVIPSQRDGD